MKMWFEMFENFVNCWLKNPEKNFVFVGSLYYRTSVYWESLKDLVDPTSWCKTQQILQICCVIEDLILVYMKDVAEVRLIPSCELILQQIKKRGRKDEVDITIEKIEHLRDIENKIKKHTKYFETQNNEINCDFFFNKWSFEENSFIKPCFSYFSPDLFKEFNNFWMIEAIITLFHKILVLEKEENIIKKNISLLPWTTSETIEEIEQSFFYFLSIQKRGQIIKKNLYDSLNIKSLQKEILFLKTNKEIIVLKIIQEKPKEEKFILKMFEDFNQFINYIEIFVVLYWSEKKERVHCWIVDKNKSIVNYKIQILTH